MPLLLAPLPLLLPLSFPLLLLLLLLLPLLLQQLLLLLLLPPLLLQQLLLPLLLQQLLLPLLLLPLLLLLLLLHRLPALFPRHPGRESRASATAAARCQRGWPWLLPEAAAVAHTAAGAGPSASPSAGAASPGGRRGTS